MTRQWLSRPSRSPWPALILLIGLLVPLCLVPTAGAQSLLLEGELICLDPGHGGDDPGATNEEYGLNESDINLEVSFALRALLEEQGAVVKMTREDDAYLTNRQRYTFCNDAGATLLISVHTNSYTDEIWDGSTTLWSKQVDKALAQAIHDVLYPYLRDTLVNSDGFTDYGLTKFQSGVLLKSDMPAAMMEPVFMSNAVEADALRVSVFDETGAVSHDCEDYGCRRGQIAQAIYLGILNYYESTPTPEPGGKKGK